MGTFRNLKRLMGDAADDAAVSARMSLPPVNVAGLGEDSQPVDVYPNDDPRSELRPVVGGYPADYGLDLRDDTSKPVPVKRPAVARKPAAPVDTSEMDPALAKAVAGLGGVADRAQAQMEGDTPTPGGGTRMAGAMSGAVQSAAMGAGAVKRSPLIPPEVRDFAKAKAENADPSSEYDKARKQADLERGLSSLTQNVHAGLDTATRMKTEGYGNAMAEDADRVDSQVAQAKEFALKKLGLDRQARQDALDEEMKRAQMDRMAAEAEKDRRGPEAKPRDALADAKTQAEIDEIKARTAALGKRGGSGHAAGAAAASKPGAQIPASEAAGIGELDAADKSLDALMKNWESEADQSFVPDGLAQYFGGTKANRYANETVTGAAQTIGTILEGGKLTDADLPKYKAMLPSAGDSKERAQAKIDKLRAAIAAKKAAKIAGLKAAGFNADGFAPTDAAPIQSGGGDTTKTTPSGKPYARKQHNAKMGKTRYLDASGAVVEEANGLI